MSDPRISPRIMATLEYLPACKMNLREAAVKAGYSKTYARKLVGRFAREPHLQEALCRRISRLLEEAGQSDKVIVARILQRWHIDAHRVSGGFVTSEKHLPLRSQSPGRKITII